jgi:DNA invertase Pin-like site-specific DNA recombinase
MLNVLASVAQFEREVMLERQREGIAKAKASDIGRLRPGRGCPAFVLAFALSRRTA